MHYAPTRAIVANDRYCIAMSKFFSETEVAGESAELAKKYWR